MAYLEVLNRCGIRATYYAWLRHRMENARKAHESGAVDDITFNTLREQFNVIHTWTLMGRVAEAQATAQAQKCQGNFG
jgi:hypothetical protein